MKCPSILDVRAAGSQRTVRAAIAELGVTARRDCDDVSLRAGDCVGASVDDEVVAVKTGL